jgi:UDP-glucose 4-epimerase
MIYGEKIFISGGAGFIGTSVARKLAKENKIVLFDNFTRQSPMLDEVSALSNVDIIHGDVLNTASIKDAMSNSSMIIHAAAIAGIDSVIRNPVRTMQVNIIGTSNVLEVATTTPTIKKVINFSTSEVFGAMSYKSRESDATVVGSAGEARWTYAVSKLAGEHLADAFSKQSGVPIVTLRPFNIYGPGQIGEGALKHFIINALRDDDILIHGDGSQIRAWCYVDDFVDGLTKSLVYENTKPESFNIGNPRAVITILGLASTVIRVLGSRSRIIHVDPLSADIEIRIPSTEKAKRELNFVAKVDLDEGIRRTADSFLATGQ